jgi:hypothetical protein
MQRIRCFDGRAAMVAPRAAALRNGMPPSMNLENALKRHLPRVWFRFKFLKYKYFGRRA